MKKTILSALSSLFLVMFLSIPQGHAQARITIEPDNQQDVIEFMQEFGVTSCFTKSPEKTNKIITALELGCLLLKTTGQKDLAPFTAFRKLINQGVYPSGIEKEDSVNEIELLEYGMRANGITIPVFIPDTQWSFTDLEPNPVIQKAIEVGIFAPASDSKVGIRTNKKINRSEAIALLYKLSLIESANHSLFNLQPQTVHFNLDYQNPQLNTLEATIQNIREKSLYRNQFNETEAVNQAIKTLVGTLDDPFSEYYTPEENQRFFQGLSGDLEGIGAYIEKKDGELTIITPIKGGPAEKAGLKAGDIITHINGNDISDFTVQEAVAIIKGPAGTQVTLTIKRKSSVLDVSVTREKIKVPAVNVSKEDGVYIIQIVQFGLNAANEIKPVLEQAQRENAKGVVIDLRNNPGGFLHVVVEMLDFFVNEGDNVVQIKTLEETSPSPAYIAPIIKDIPVAILINKGSASASEILAGTMKDYGLATIIGETSYGKGSVQEVISFNDGSALKITTALWLTGLGNSIDHVGVKPDIQIGDDPGTTEDEVMEKAFEVIRNGNQRSPLRR